MVNAVEQFDFCELWTADHCIFNAIELVLLSANSYLARGQVAIMKPYIMIKSKRYRAFMITCFSLHGSKVK